MGVKFGEGPLLHAKLHPIGATEKQLKFLLRFDQNVEYKHPTGVYPCAIFTKLAEFVPRFRIR